MKTLFTKSNIIKRILVAVVAVVTLNISLAMSTLEAFACTNEVANQSSMQAVAGGNNSYSYEYEGGGTDAVSRGQRWVGRAKYVWGACEPGQFDEAGFVSYCVTGCYRRIGTLYTFRGWPQTTNPQPGDVCVDRGTCGIYIGDGKMMYAANEELGIRIDPVYESMYFVRSPY